MENSEKRLCRRELINYYLQAMPLWLRDIKILVRNSEVYRYGHELKLQ